MNKPRVCWRSSLKEALTWATKDRLRLGDHPAGAPVNRGFTLLEVLVALTILGLAIVTLMQLSSHGLRLLRLSDDYQKAVFVADRVARSVDVPEAGIEIGQDGAFRWERRVSLVAVPDELTPGAGPKPRLYAISVAVRWGGSRTLELASLRAVAGNPGQ